MGQPAKKAARPPAATKDSRGFTDPRYAPSQRKCMTCGRSFISEGIHNRMCRGCKQRAAGTTGTE